MQIKNLLPSRREGNVFLVLRIILAIVFALTAFIFTEVVPTVPPFDKTVLRVLITVWFGLLGYGLFPDLAKTISTTAISFMNGIISRVGTEVMNQMMRIQSAHPFGQPVGVQASGSGVNVSSPLILDTSAIIDGRILDIAKTSFLYGLVLIPQFILQELQQVADSADFLKRSRGRRGFEIIEELKKIKGIRIEIWDKDIMAKAADDKLVKLAKNLRGKIITTDFNLNKVASISGVTVLNINDLANAVKTIAVPGEGLVVKVVHLGKDPTQGVGYLPDGTMIVVESGAEAVGKEVKTAVSRVLQSSAGRMIFVKPN